MQAYIVIEGTTTGVVVARFATQAEATAHAATDNSLTAITGAQPMTTDDLVGVAYYDGTSVVAEAPVTSAEQLALRREVLYTYLRQAEDLGPLPVWHAAAQTGDDRNRYYSYGHWVEANTRAAMVDANLTDDAKYTILRNECAIPGATWYWLHRVDGAASTGGWHAIYGNDNRSLWIWHQTTGTSTEPNSRWGALPSRLETATVTAAASGAVTIEVDSTDGFGSRGRLHVGGQVVTYTGKTATSFTGCTGTPTIAVGDTVSQSRALFIRLDTTGNWIHALR